jgi:hypothetical protein
MMRSAIESTPAPALAFPPSRLSGKWCFVPLRANVFSSGGAIAMSFRRRGAELEVIANSLGRLSSSCRALSPPRSRRDGDRRDDDRGGYGRYCRESSALCPSRRHNDSVSRTPPNFRERYDHDTNDGFMDPMYFLCPPCFLSVICLVLVTIAN